MYPCLTPTLIETPVHKSRAVEYVGAFSSPHILGTSFGFRDRNKGFHIRARFGGRRSIFFAPDDMSAFIVTAPTLPSTPSLLLFWKERTAVSVSDPKYPVALEIYPSSFRRFCTRSTSAPFAPMERAFPCASEDMSICLVCGPDIPVRDQPVAYLKPLDGGFGIRSEVPVRRGREVPEFFQPLLIGQYLGAFFAV